MFLPTNPAKNIGDSKCEVYENMKICTIICRSSLEPLKPTNLATNGDPKHNVIHVSVGMQFPNLARNFYAVPCLSSSQELCNACSKSTNFFFLMAFLREFCIILLCLSDKVS